jgi:hypothetical protein
MNVLYAKTIEIARSGLDNPVSLGSYSLQGTCSSHLQLISIIVHPKIPLQVITNLGLSVIIISSAKFALWFWCYRF